MGKHTTPGGKLLRHPAFNLPRDVHKRIRRRRQRAAAFGDETSIWRRISAPMATELLFSQNGEAEALKIARLELQKTRRARSGKRFDFWTAVAQEMQVAHGGLGEDKRRSR